MGTQNGKGSIDATKLQRHVCEGVLGKRILLYHSMVYAMQRMYQHDFEVFNTYDTEVNDFNCVWNITEKDVASQSGWASSKYH